MKVDLIRDVLDKQLVDRNERKMGKVDGLVMQLREGEPPRVSFIEVSTITLARRLHPRLAKIVARLSRKLGGEQHAEPFRLPWSKLTLTGNDVTVGVDSDKTPSQDWQRWLKRNLIGRIPGA
ncbi:MAG: hypothetical protein JOZ52_12365 [Acidobacteria bacterium]|nr:hypothetical protein [Acidobacteriota bacterium]